MHTWRVPILSPQKGEYFEISNRDDKDVAGAYKENCVHAKKEEEANAFCLYPTKA